MNGGSVKSVDSYKNLKELFSPSVVAKVWGIAQRDLNNVFACTLPCSLIFLRYILMLE